MNKLSSALALALLGAPFCLATTAQLGTIASDENAVFNLGTTTTEVLGGPFNLTGNADSTTFNHFVGDFTFPVSGSETSPTSQETTDFGALLTGLDGLSYSPLTFTDAGVNNIAPGFYSVAGNVTLSAGTIINLTGSGQYTFKFAGSFIVSGITVNPASGLNLDDVFWYISDLTSQVSVTNSDFFGDIVVGSSNAPNQVVVSDGTTHSFTGRFLTGGTSGTTTFETTGLNSIMNFSEVTPPSGIPEPSSFVLFGTGLLLAGVMLRRRNARG